MSEAETKKGAAEESVKGKEDNTDPYAYLQNQGFSSENFKIEVHGLPKYFGMGQLKKLFNSKLQLNVHKLKPAGKDLQWMYVCFKNEDDRQKALKVLNGYEWKKNTLSAQPAKAAADPLVAKRKEDMEREDEKSEGPEAKRAKVTGEVVPPGLDLLNMPVGDKIKEAVIPLRDVPYKEQLQKKTEEVQGFLKGLGDDIENTNPDLLGWLEKQKEKYGYACELEDIRPSPITDEYRNKCEFTVGLNPETQETTVGFRLSSYKEGSMGVGPIDDMRHLPKKMTDAVQAFQTYLELSDMPPYNPETQEGYWKQLTVRTARSGDMMLLVIVHPQSLSPQALQELKDDIKMYFEKGDGKWCGVSSLYFQAIGQKEAGVEYPLEHISGVTHITETLFNLKFRISPEAFFQVNSCAAEVLYRTIGEVAKLTQTTSMVDVCCGTGTIGLCLAKQCGQVLGLEVIHQAIEDAKMNAFENNISNCEFFAGKAEDFLGALLRRTAFTNIIAVVDPPRAGLHQKAIFSVRKNERLKKLVYVACDAKAAMKNFVDLGRPRSNTFKGDPFVPMKVVPVDLFPHTNHCEVVILFERVDPSALPKSKLKPGVKKNTGTTDVQQHSNSRDPSASLGKSDVGGGRNGPADSDSKKQHVGKDSRHGGGSQKEPEEPSKQGDRFGGRDKEKQPSGDDRLSGPPKKEFDRPPLRGERFGSPPRREFDRPQGIGSRFEGMPDRGFDRPGNDRFGKSSEGDRPPLIEDRFGRPMAGSRFNKPPMMDNKFNRPVNEDRFSRPLMMGDRFDKPPGRDDNMNRPPGRDDNMNRPPGRDDNMNRPPGRDDSMNRSPMGRDRFDRFNRPPAMENKLGGPSPSSGDTYLEEALAMMRKRRMEGNREDSRQPWNREPGKDDSFSDMDSPGGPRRRMGITESLRMGRTGPESPFLGPWALGKKGVPQGMNRPMLEPSFPGAWAMKKDGPPDMGKMGSEAPFQRPWGPMKKDGPQDVRFPGPWGQVKKDGPPCMGRMGPEGPMHGPWGPMKKEGLLQGLGRPGSDVPFPGPWGPMKKDGPPDMGRPGSEVRFPGPWGPMKKDGPAEMGKMGSETPFPGPWGPVKKDGSVNVEKPGDKDGSPIEKRGEKDGNPNQTQHGAGSDVTSGKEEQSEGRDMQSPKLGASPGPKKPDVPGRPSLDVQKEEWDGSSSKEDSVDPQIPPERKKSRFSDSPTSTSRPLSGEVQQPVLTSLPGRGPRGLPLSMGGPRGPPLSMGGPRGPPSIGGPGRPPLMGGGPGGPSLMGGGPGGPSLMGGPGGPSLMGGGPGGPSLMGGGPSLMGGGPGGQPPLGGFGGPPPPIRGQGVPQPVQGPPPVKGSPGDLKLDDSKRKLPSLMDLNLQPPKHQQQQPLMGNKRSFDGPEKPPFGFDTPTSEARGPMGMGGTQTDYRGSWGPERRQSSERSFGLAGSASGFVDSPSKDLPEDTGENWNQSDSMRGPKGEQSQMPPSSRNTDEDAQNARGFPGTGPPRQSTLRSDSDSSQKPGGPSQNTGGPPQNTGGPPQNTGGPPQNTGGPPQNTGGPPLNTGGPPLNTGGPPPNTGGPPPNTGGPPPNTGGPPQNMGGPPQNMGGPPQNMGGPPQNMGGPPQNMGGPPQNMGGPPQNMGGPPQKLGDRPQNSGGPPQNYGDNYGSEGPPQMYGGPPDNRTPMKVGPPNIGNVQMKYPPPTYGGPQGKGGRAGSYGGWGARPTGMPPFQNQGPPSTRFPPPNYRFPPYQSTDRGGPPSYGNKLDQGQEKGSGPSQGEKGGGSTQGEDKQDPSGFGVHPDTSTNTGVPPKFSSSQDSVTNTVGPPKYGVPPPGPDTQRSQGPVKSFGTLGPDYSSNAGQQRQDNKGAGPGGPQMYGYSGASAPYTQGPPPTGNMPYGQGPPRTGPMPYTQGPPPSGPMPYGQGPYQGSSGQYGQTSQYGPVNQYGKQTAPPSQPAKTQNISTPNVYGPPPPPPETPANQGGTTAGGQKQEDKDKKNKKDTKDKKEDKTNTSGQQSQPQADATAAASGDYGQYSWWSQGQDPNQSYAAAMAAYQQQWNEWYAAYGHAAAQYSQYGQYGQYGQGASATASPYSQPPPSTAAAYGQTSTADTAQYGHTGQTDSPEWKTYCAMMAQAWSSLADTKQGTQATGQQSSQPQTGYQVGQQGQTQTAYQANQQGGQPPASYPPGAYSQGGYYGPQGYNTTS